MAEAQPRGWGIESPCGIPTIAIGNQKGGTGKTTTSINAAGALAQKGHNVLVIDMDPQADTTKGLGLGPGDTTDPDSPKNSLPNLLETDDPNLLDVLVNNPRTAETGLDEIILRQTDYDHLAVDLIPSHKDMGLARDWMDDADSNYALERALDALVTTGYETDFILIDCPPDLSVLTDASFIAARNVFIAAQPHATSRDALDDLWDQLETVEQEIESEIGLIALLANMYREDGQSRKFLQRFNDEWQQYAPVFTLPVRVAIQRAWDQGMDIYEWDDNRPQDVERDAFLEIATTIEQAFNHTQRTE